MADSKLSGRSALVVVANYGVEQDELLVPVQHLRDAGAEVHIAAVTADPIQTLVGDKDPGQKVSPDRTLDDVDASAYDVLVLPGGTLNADALRLQDKAVALVRAFPSAHRPVAAICHGPWGLVEADVVKGKTLTSYPSLRTDIRNAGGHWVDESAVSDHSNGWTLVTSRTPDDLEDFLKAIEAALTETAP
ncbi:type 1 glutamine amidotransferase domain-containing protein [Streptomyces lydicus]|uniref:type 1 glutamine amidotransferase domain-containing protein n=1 Tax=Streptomyces lydicus TaxID=47763 RepID=UPI0033D69209